MHRTLGWLAPALLGVMLTAPAATAHVRLEAQGTRPPVVQAIDTGTRVDANQIGMFVTNVGSFAWDLETGNSGLEYPLGSGKTAVFAAGLWMGASVGGAPRVTVAEYSQEYSPGPMAGGTFQSDRAEFKVYKVTREPLSSSPADSMAWMAANDDWVTNAAPQGAPVVLDTLDTTAPYDSVVTRPAVLGDQTLWTVFNDADPGVHTNNAGNSAPLGVEVQLTTFAFNRLDPLGQVVFLKYRIINKGSNTLDSTYVSIWSDPDLGGAGDDLVGVDVPQSLGFCYNATNRDNVYGSTPPCVGYDFFQGPLADDGMTILGMSSFNKYINGTDPKARAQSYNYMKGLLPDGSPVINPVTGDTTTFYDSGDPVTNTGWLDTNPADRRLMLSSGPFTMVPNDTQEVVTAVVMGQGRDRLTSITAMRYNDVFAQAAFDANFVLPNPPPPPTLAVQAEDGAVLLKWGNRSEVTDPVFGYAFEGYNVYQGETQAGPWHRIATFDVNDGIGYIFDDVFDIETGVVLNKPVQFGTDTGVSYSLRLTDDKIRGGPLHNGTAYYYAVTAYSYAPTAVPKTLENAQAQQTVIPQRPTAGSDLSVAAALPVVQDRYDTNLPATTDVVTVGVIDPAAVTGCRYEVYYTPNTPPYPTYNGNDVLNSWNLRRICGTDTTVVLADQLNKTGDDRYLVADGLQVKVSGAYKPELQSVTYVKVDTEARDLQAIDWGGAFYGGAADYAIVFFDSSLDPDADPDAFTTVEIRFSDVDTQKAYYYYRDELADGSAPPAGRGYTYGGFGDCRFQIWDTVNDRQLDAFFVERRIVDAGGVPLPQAQQPASNDGTWDPTTDDGNGGREYLFLGSTTYTDTPKPEFEVDADPIGAGSGTPGPQLYAGWFYALDAANPYPDNGEKMVWLWANPGRANDVFRFETTPPIKDDASLARAALDKIRVVPNPYYGRSTYELNQFARQIRFMNLPSVCTIRIFNLAGDLVRTMHKDDASTSVLTWDAQTDDALPVGSGIYIYHVDAPGVGSTFGRMVVFTEKERLNNF